MSSLLALFLISVHSRRLIGGFRMDDKDPSIGAIFILNVTNGMRF